MFNPDNLLEIERMRDFSKTIQEAEKNNYPLKRGSEFPWSIYLSSLRHTLSRFADIITIDSFFNRFSRLIESKRAASEPINILDLMGPAYFITDPTFQRIIGDVTINAVALTLTDPRKHFRDRCLTGYPNAEWDPIAKYDLLPDNINFEMLEGDILHSNTWDSLDAHVAQKGPFDMIINRGVGGWSFIYSAQKNTQLSNVTKIVGSAANLLVPQGIMLSDGDLPNRKEYKSGLYEQMLATQNTSPQQPLKIEAFAPCQMLITRELSKS